MSPSPPSTNLVFSLRGKGFDFAVAVPALGQGQARGAATDVYKRQLISLVLAIYKSATLVGLLLTGYAGVTQFFPGVVLGLYWRGVTMRGVFTGMMAGVATVIFLMLSHRDPLFGLSLIHI